MSTPEPQANPAPAPSPAAPAQSKAVSALRGLLLAEANSPAVHSALRALQAAIVSTAVVAVKAYFGL